MTEKQLTHFDEAGRPNMVDISNKSVTDRHAIAEGAVRMNLETLSLVQSGEAKKGDVAGIAELAAIMGAKRTSDLIPLCHPLPLTKLNAEVTIDKALPGLKVTVEAKTNGKTGVEMEALTGVSVACLTIYDMLKAADREMQIIDIKLLKKTGGASGDWNAA